jgi:cbb3-type cytochrome oxidase maturation protein
MDILIYLIPLALGLGALALVGFLMAIRGGQFEDLEGAATRILYDDGPLPDRPRRRPPAPRSEGTVP